jgi:hypothetical protein
LEGSIIWARVERGTRSSVTRRSSDEFDARHKRGGRDIVVVMWNGISERLRCVYVPTGTEWYFPRSPVDNLQSMAGNEWGCVCYRTRKGAVGPY